MDRIRVASMQYFIRPVAAFDQFRDQVVGLVGTAADYGCHLVVFPEYFTVQLLTLASTHDPMPEQIRRLAGHRPRYVELMAELARRHGVYIVAGTIPVADDGGRIRNVCHIFSPSGGQGTQGKLQMTRFESEEWGVAPAAELNVFETDFGRLAVAICYDVEFPEIARAAARLGANVLAVPSCTDDRQGYLRVRYCAQARAIENQMYVIQSSTVGSLTNTGVASPGTTGSSHSTVALISIPRGCSSGASSDTRLSIKAAMSTVPAHPASMA